jgi:hypothetical protein
MVMISTIPIAIGLIAFIGFYQLLKPRIPYYVISVKTIFPTFLMSNQQQQQHSKQSRIAAAATTTTSSSSFFAYELSANIMMHNDNFIKINIHALTFDMFYPNNYKNNNKINNELRHIGQITDTRQYTKWWSSSSKSTDSEIDGNDNNNNNINIVNSTDLNFMERQIARRRRQSRLLPPMWELEPRSDFTIDDAMYMMMPFADLSYGALFSLLWDVLVGWGHVKIPLTGVLHIGAAAPLPAVLAVNISSSSSSSNNNIPLTLSIFCKNSLNVWTLTVEGIHCDLDNLVPGWKRMDIETNRLRRKFEYVQWFPTKTRSENDDDDDDDDKTNHS